MSSESPQIDGTASQPDTSPQDPAQEGNGAKRKAEQSNGTQMRSKRNRYISIAWCVLNTVEDGNGGDHTQWDWLLTGCPGMRQ